MPEHKEYRLAVSRRAARQLREHAAFAARLDEHLARKLIDGFQEAAKSLAHMPYRMPLLDLDTIPRGKYRKCSFNKWYLILYQIQDDTVYIEYVIDGRQDYGWLID